MKKFYALAEYTYSMYVISINTRFQMSQSVRPVISAFVLSSAANREYTGWPKDRVLKPAPKLSLILGNFRTKRECST